MTRLTKRNTDGSINLYISDRVSKKVHNKNEYYGAIQKLIKYEDLEEKGLLIELPCKVGDTLYLLDHECTEGMKYNCEIDGIMEGYLCRTCGTYPCTLRPSVQEVIVDSITIVEDNEIIINFKDLREVKVEDFGKTVFTTREKAEEKLKEIRNNG